MSTVHYTFDLTRPHTHLIDVEMRLPAHAEAHLDLVLPAWLPGAYKIFDNARNLRSFASEDANGLPVRLTYDLDGASAQYAFEDWAQAGALRYPRVTLQLDRNATVELDLFEPGARTADQVWEPPPR